MRTKDKTIYGVYPHAEHSYQGTIVTGLGYVTRVVGRCPPYGDLMPLRQYERRCDADKFGDKLTFGRHKRDGVKT